MTTTYNNINKKIVGYTCGVFDLFHIAHLNLLRNARGFCDILVVGVSTDELAMEYKGKKPIIPYEERAEIVRNIKYVDLVVPQTNRDKLEAHHKLKYDVLIVGDDWFNQANWSRWESDLKKNFNVNTIYLPRTPGISTTEIIAKIKNKN
jgi:glycerol-3-phosphate cytidylyltransferase